MRSNYHLFLEIPKDLLGRKKQLENINFLSFQDGGYGKHGWLEDCEISEFQISKQPLIIKKNIVF